MVEKKKHYRKFTSRASLVHSKDEKAGGPDAVRNEHTTFLPTHFLQKTGSRGIPTVFKMHPRLTVGVCDDILLLTGFKSHLCHFLVM